MSLRIQLLGGYAHFDGGHERLPRKLRALLAYLAMQGARGASRDQVTDLLWPSSEPARARHSLRQCLASTRRLLGEVAPDLVAASDRDLLALRSNAVDVDVHRFLTLAQSHKIPDLAAAAELYQGPFLADFDAGADAFEIWARAERARLDGVAALALRHLSAALAETGDSEGAIAAARRLTALDPLNEDDCRTLMRLLMAAGRRVEALRQFETLRETLRAELDLHPNEATSALARTLRADVQGATETDRDTSSGQSGAGIRRPDDKMEIRPIPAETARQTHEFSARSWRPLGVLACEWLGAETLPEERQYQALAECYRRSAAQLVASGAHVARNASDGIVAYFGFSRTREQDAETCARAALALQALAPRLCEEFGAAIRLSAGVAYGPVVVAEQPRGQEPGAMGSAVSLASRLKGLAAPDEILVAPGARELLRGLFRYGEARAVDVKGFVDPIQVAPILGATSTESRFEALRPHGLGPMVGRDEELDRLARRWRHAGEGEGAVVLIVGEPGIGKSRLVQTYVGSLGAEGGAPVFLYCSPQGRDSALHPFASVLKRMADLEDTDSEARRRAKLAAMIAGAKLPSYVLPWLAPLAGVTTESRDAIATSPDLGRHKMLSVLASLIEARAARNAAAALIIVEDVHWADPTTIEWLDELVERARNRRLLLVLTARPEYSPSWADRAHATTMSLPRLPAREATEIVMRATAGSALPSAAVQRIVALAEGVPLFLEELSFAVLSKRAGSRLETENDGMALEVPRSLHTLLLSRLDQLGAARQVAQTAASLGRTFNRKLIGAATTLSPADLDEALARLVEQEWVWRRGDGFDSEYVFRHALLQDAAYHSLPAEERRALHERIVSALEAQRPELVAARPELVARHCAEAGLLDKAAVLWAKAGQISLGKSTLQEAVAQFKKALAILESLESTKHRRAEQLTAQIGLANALMHTRGYAAVETRAAFARAQDYYANAEGLGETPDDPTILLAVLHGIWVASHVAFDGPTVRELSGAFMSFVAKRPTNFAQAVAHRVMGTSLLFLGDFTGARTHLDHALALYEPAAHRQLATRFGQDIGVAVLSNRPLVLWLLGHPDEADRDADDAIALARSVGQVGTLLYMLTRIAWIKLTIGDVATADELIGELAALAEDVEGAYWTAAASLLRGCHDALVGDAAAAVELIGAGVAVSRARGAKLLRLPWYLLCLAKAHARLGDCGAARSSLDEAFDAVSRTEEAWPESELHRFAGELALSVKNPDRFAAAAHFDRALSLARRQHARSYELRAAIDLASLRLEVGETRRALEILRPVYQRFAPELNMPDLKRAAILIDELRDSVGARHN